MKNPNPSSPVNLSSYRAASYAPGKSLLTVTLWRLIGMPLVKLIPDEVQFYHFFNNLRIFILRLFGASIGSNCIIRAIEVYHPWKISIGDNVWLGYGVNLYSLAPIRIGSNVCVSQNAYLCTGTHNPYSPQFDLITKEIVLEDGSWVCANCFVGPGVTLHRGSVAGAGSIVVDDLPEMTVCTGNPCRPLKKRVMTASTGHGPE
jgi:putative colanic acid biosynthesis acetyltransferase WcaF